MQHDSASFWSDIKFYEERLAQDPESYLFARLSEVYLKVNLVDDALHTARQGVVRYPTYIAGQRALAMASYAKGLYDESRQSLEKVASAVPEDVEVQKLLGRLLVSHGSLDSAQKAYRTALEFSPDDQECRDELESILQGAAVPFAYVAPVLESNLSESAHNESDTDSGDDDFEIIELQESDIVEDDEANIEPVPEHHDPLSTATLAELYAQQGFTSKSLDIYRTILAENPANETVKTRISELEAIDAASSADLVVSCGTDSIHDSVSQEMVSQSTAVSTVSAADGVVSTLECWLDNIRRIKACR